MVAHILPEGKIPIEVLKPILERMPRGNLLVQRGIGMDIGITRLQGEYLVFSSGCARDSKKKLGENLVYEVARQVAKRGIKPNAIDPVVLFPRGTSARQVRRVLLEISNAASRLGITVAKGHTEITPGLDKLTIIVTVFGSGK